MSTIVHCCAYVSAKCCTFNFDFRFSMNDFSGAQIHVKTLLSISAHEFPTIKFIRKSFDYVRLCHCISHLHIIHHFIKFDKWCTERKKTLYLKNPLFTNCRTTNVPSIISLLKLIDLFLWRFTLYFWCPFSFLKGAWTIKTHRHTLT